MFLKSEGRGGGPNDPLIGFESVFQELFGTFDGQSVSPEDRKYFDAKSHPLYDILKKYSHSLTPGGPGTIPLDHHGEEGQNTLEERSRSYKQISIELATMSEEWRVNMSADEVFGVYLRDVASKTNEMFYRMMMRYVMLYRECLNEYGWQKRAEAECREAK